MKIERLKSILLVILVISSIVLTVNKWFNEKLWPEGYNFFSNVKNYFDGSDNSKTQTEFNPVDEVVKPSKIILNNGGKHILFTKSSAEFESLFAPIKTVLTLVAQDKTDAYQKIGVDEWNNLLKGTSCYFSYGVEFDSNYFFSHLSGQGNSNLSYVKEFVISVDQRIPSVIYLHAKDARSGDIYKYRYTLSEDNALAFLSENYHTEDIYYYSFELNFDKIQENTVEQPIVIEPDVLINIMPKNIPVISAYNCFTDVAGRADVYTPLLSNFGYNSSTIRKYIEHDNSIVFVENYGTVKFHSNGILDYKSVDSSKGISLAGNTNNECINSCLEFVNSICESLGLGGNVNCEISSDISDIKGKTFTLYFDYYINDNMISVPSQVYNMEHAVAVDVVSGKITGYRQLCMDFANNGGMIECSSSIDAIDTLQLHNNFSDKKIYNLFTAYIYNSDLNVWQPSWCVEDSEGNVSSIVEGAGV